MISITWRSAKLMRMQRRDMGLMRRAFVNTVFFVLRILVFDRYLYLWHVGDQFFFPISSNLEAWRLHHPRLQNAVYNAIHFADSNRTPCCYSGDFASSWAIHRSRNTQFQCMMVPKHSTAKQSFEPTEQSLPHVLDTTIIFGPIAG